MKKSLKRSLPKRFYIGIDPGKTGGLVILPERGDKKVVTQMPTTERDIWNWFADIPSPSFPFAVIEKVGSMPGNAARAMFTFGWGYGGLRMALVARGIPFEEVTPQVWLKGLGIPFRKRKESRTQFKNRLKGRAQQLFPDVAVTLATADALLIATYCQRKASGTL